MPPVLLLLASLASATELNINAADGQTAVVLVDDFVKGETPVVTDVEGGEVTLSFRSSMFGPVLFTKTLTVPSSGRVAYVVDMSERTVVAATGGESSSSPADTPEEEAVTQIRIALEGASIHLDGNDTGKVSPATLSVDPGRHELELLKGCERGTSSVTVNEGTTLDADITLRAAKFLLKIETDPVGASILVDGEELGKSPLEAKLSCGERDVKAMLDGHLAAMQTVSLDGADSLKLKLERELFGSMEITVEPSNTTIKLDGEKIGTGSATLEKVRTGPHVLTLERKGEVLEERTITVKENGEMILSLVVSSTGSGKATKPEKPAKEPKAAKDKNPKKSAGRILVNSVVTLGAVPFVPLGLYNYQQARIAYDDYQLMPDGQARDDFYKTEVAPRQTVAFAEWGVGGALLATGTALWITSFVDAPITVVPTRNGLLMSGRF